VNLAARIGRKDSWQLLPIMIRWQRKGAIVPTRNINLTEHLDYFVERQVASGRYSNASEIVRESLRLLEEREQERKAKLKALRQAAKQGFDEIDQGKGVVLKGKKAINQFVADIETEVRTEAAQNAE
jgi:antitoxin ParD1/3/4